jgi:molecular chaperone HtpG
MNNYQPQLGKYILDSLSIGMYNHPFLIIREYIQNSTDAIDAIRKNHGFNNKCSKIDIHIDGRNKSLTIKDNGIGLPLKSARSILLDIGKSKKRLKENRGFRGIGRLGGLGYCKELQFKTKAQGEKKYSICKWNCEKLQKIIKDNSELRIADVIVEITEFEQNFHEKDIRDHFFSVKMINLNSSRDMLLNVPLIKNYISEVAPVPFKENSFDHAKLIDSTLRKHIPNYKTYNIYVNGEKIYKPYKNRIVLRGKNKDEIKKIKFISLENEKQKLAYGWLAELRLLGTVSSSTFCDGIRIRSGNILIGDKSLLSPFFREKRFNNYLVGEIHTKNDSLIPNSRRDDFEDNNTRDEFVDSFIKNIGLPYSKIIRELSQERSRKKRIHNNENIISKAHSIVENGYFSVIEKESVIEELEKIKIDQDINSNGEIETTINKLINSNHFFDNTSNGLPEDRIALLKSIFDIIYSKSNDLTAAEKIISSIIKNVLYKQSDRIPKNILD